ncbi:membrane protein of unknown function [Denitratisoma oestradiolicum]|uniref:Uncharacterized protein n=1 Tax=Denitratisoma oestradiolicum TaxID=311182 RepID=A0A6S6Y156_9PROT|nr:membrane protein of unknown function [Denitratisoma oestradiolicum]
MISTGAISGATAFVSATIAAVVGAAPPFAGLDSSLTVGVVAPWACVRGSPSSFGIDSVSVSPGREFSSAWTVATTGGVCTGGASGMAPAVIVGSAMNSSASKASVTGSSCSAFRGSADVGDMELTVCCWNRAAISAARPPGAVATSGRVLKSVGVAGAASPGEGMPVTSRAPNCFSLEDVSEGASRACSKVAKVGPGEVASSPTEAIMVPDAAGVGDRLGVMSSSGMACSGKVKGIGAFDASSVPLTMGADAPGTAAVLLLVGFVFFGSACRVLVLRLLVLAVLGMALPVFMAFGQRIVGFYLSTLAQPLLLARSSALLGEANRVTGLVDGSIQTIQKGLEVAPLIPPQAILRGLYETAVVLGPVLDQHFQALCGLLLTGDQFAEPTGGLVQPHLRQVQQGLQRETCAHGPSRPPDRGWHQARRIDR